MPWLMLVEEGTVLYACSGLHLAKTIVIPAIPNNCNLPLTFLLGFQVLTRTCIH